jgi:hypothetical protein
MSLERDPVVGVVRDAVTVAQALVAPIGQQRAEDGAELAASLAIMECCAIEAAIERGRVRRKLLEIARGKAARACAAIDIAVAWRAVAFFDVADARAALVEAERALTHPDYGCGGAVS